MRQQPASRSVIVRDTCAELINMGKPVTFTAVAERSGLSRTTLYRRHDLRELIEQHRDPAGNTLTLTQLAAQIEQLRLSPEAVAANVRRHEEHLRAINRTARAS